MTNINTLHVFVVLCLSGNVRFMDIVSPQDEYIKCVFTCQDAQYTKQNH